MAGIATDTANCGIRLFSAYNYSENYDFRNSCVSKAAVTLLLQIEFSQRLHITDTVI